MATSANPALGYLKRAIVLWVGAIFFVAGSAGVGTTIGEWRVAQRFTRDSLAAQATVVARTLQSASRERNSSTRYLVAYRFIARDGAAVEQTEELPFDAWETLKEGSTLEVRYLPSNPYTARSRAPEPPWVPPLLIGVTAAFALLGLLLARPGVRRLRTILRVQRNGVDAQATVVDVAPTGTMINRVQQWRVRYEFRDRQGHVQTGESDLLPPQEAAEWRQGEQVAIRFDPAAPRDSYWLGKRGG